MARLNLDPLVTFSDGSHLVVSTEHSGDGLFTCELFVVRSSYDGRLIFVSVSMLMRRTSSMGAQDCAYRSAQRLYPKVTDDIKKPPYLIWCGPQTRSEPS